MEKKTANRKLYFLVIISLICGYGLGIMNKKGEIERVSEEVAAKVNVKYRDTGYKMFYGEWEVVKVVSYHHYAYELLEYAESLIGTRVEYYEDKVIYEDKGEPYTIENPYYNMVIMPILNPGDSYVRYLGSFEELGLTGEFFVYTAVKVDNLDFSKENLGAVFYIKDDNTLIADYGEFCFEMKRISHYPKGFIGFEERV